MSTQSLHFEVFSRLGLKTPRKTTPNNYYRVILSSSKMIKQLNQHLSNCFNKN